MITIMEKEKKHITKRLWTRMRASICRVSVMSVNLCMEGQPLQDKLLPSSQAWRLWNCTFVLADFFHILLAKTINFVMSTLNVYCCL